MSDKRMPVLFTGHGNPMNAITENRARSGWKQIGEILGRPKAIVCITSHWESCGTCVRERPDNSQIFDVDNLPEEIYDFHYAPKNDPETARRVLELLGDKAFPDNTWGIDHAIWACAGNIFPDGDIPIVPVSVDFTASSEEMFEIGRKLAPLRSEGILLMASGNSIHNIEMVDHSLNAGYDWACEANELINKLVSERDFEKLINYEKLKDSALAIPTPEHFMPLLAVLGASSPEDELTIFNNYVESGAISMTSYLFS